MSRTLQEVFFGFVALNFPRVKVKGIFRKKNEEDPDYYRSVIDKQPVFLRARLDLCFSLALQLLEQDE